MSQVIQKTNKSNTFQNSVTHAAFTDEAYHTEGRFRSVGMVSLLGEHINVFENEISKILQTSSISNEFKWKDLNSAKRKFAAIKLIDWVINKVKENKLRVDILVWDVEDQRHKIQSRDDAQNLSRMYHHLFKNVLTRRWPDDAVWGLYPDQNSLIDWSKQEEILSYTSLQDVPKYIDLFSTVGSNVKRRKKYAVEHVSEIESHNQPLCQIADLFAGMTVYSRLKFELYFEWQQSVSDQLALFNEPVRNRPSNADLPRLEVLKHFDAVRHNISEKPSLQSTKGLRSRDPSSPINFWWYEPQHELDKAPIKKRPDQIL